MFNDKKHHFHIITMLRHYSWRTKGLDLDDNIKITCNVQKNWKCFSVSYDTETMEHYKISSGLNTACFYRTVTMIHQCCGTQKYGHNLVDFWQKALKRLNM